MNSQPVLPKNVDVSKLNFLPPKKTPQGGKSILVNYSGERLVMQLPVLHIPYGVSDAANMMEKNPTKPPRYVLDVSFRGKENNKAINKFYEKILEIETKIKKEAYENRISWLGDNYDDMEPLVNKLFSSNVRYDKDKETGKLLNRYPPTFRLKLPYVNETEKFTFDSYDMDGNEIDFKELIGKSSLKGAKSLLLIQLVGMWFAGGKYGCTWKVVSGHFQKNQVLKYVRIQDSDDEQDTNIASVNEDDDDLDDDVVANNPSTYVSDSEEEEEEEEEEERKRNLLLLPLQRRKLQEKRLHLKVKMVVPDLKAKYSLWSLRDTTVNTFK
jgi:hypothetical protein